MTFVLVSMVISIFTPLLGFGMTIVEWFGHRAATMRTDEEGSTSTVWRWWWRIVVLLVLSGLLLPAVYALKHPSIVQVARAGAPATSSGTAANMTTTSMTTTMLAKSEDWDVQGSCGTAGSCVTSANYSSTYDQRQGCTITALKVGVMFQTEYVFDRLMVGGTQHSGAKGPEGVVLAIGDKLGWTTDSAESQAGWKLCLSQSTTSTGTTAAATTITTTSTATKATTTSRALTAGEIIDQAIADSSAGNRQYANHFFNQRKQLASAGLSRAGTSARVAAPAPAPEDFFTRGKRLATEGVVGE
mmetsp:Transcript_120646/g.386219  ORF Transcript_120646/g.386219 Transcript_120646/m.386219 type:complete len:301 (-) Transcript_120646:226-1128(-)